MAKKKAFGIPKLLSDGIGETINTANNNIGQLRYEIVSLERIKLDPTNPRDLLINKEDIVYGIQPDNNEYERKQIELKSLQSLAHSIKKTGVRNPVELYKDNGCYILISGERRVLGSLVAGKTDIPAKILDSKPDDLQLRLLQWIENVEREDLTIWERLENIEQIVNAYSPINNVSINPEQLSEIIGCSRKQSKRYLDVISAPDEIKKTLKNAGISDLIKLAMIINTKDKSQQETLIENAKAGVSRDKLTKVLDEIKQKKVSKSNKNQRRGRPSSIISVKIPIVKIPAIQRVLECILNNDEYSKYSAQFENINWTSVKQVEIAIQSMFNIFDKIK